MTNPPSILEALARCPFCGGEAKPRSYRACEDEMVAVVGCTSCGASTDHFTDAYSPTAEAIKAWNTRTPLQSPPVEQEEGDGADPALVASPSSLQAVSTKGFDPGDGAVALERALRGQWQDIATAPGTIMLEMAAASEADQMWERRWHALNYMYAIDRCFSDQDGRWGLRDFLDYAGQVCGFKQRSVLSPPSTGGGS